MHELVRLVNSAMTIEDEKRVILYWLTKKAEELKSGSWDINRAHVIDKILGLEAKEELDPITQYEKNAYEYDQRCKVEKEKEWCEHFEWQKIQGWWCFEGSYVNTDHWKQCPKCLAPRPAKKKTLAEVLSDAGRNYALENGFILPDVKLKSEDEFFAELSQAALSWFKEIVIHEGVWAGEQDLISKSELLRKLAQEAEG